MTNQFFEETVKSLQIKHKEELDKMQKEVDKIREECNKLVEIERLKRKSKQITFDWKFSKVFWYFSFVCIIAVTFTYLSITQYTIIKNQNKTIVELTVYQTIFRFAKANNGIYPSDIDRIWKEYQTSGTTALKLHIYKIISEYESGENLIKKSRKSPTKPQKQQKSY